MGTQKIKLQRVNKRLFRLSMEQRSRLPQQEALHSAANVLVSISMALLPHSKAHSLKGITTIKHIIAPPASLYRKK